MCYRPRRSLHQAVIKLLVLSLFSSTLAGLFPGGLPDALVRTSAPSLADLLPAPALAQAAPLPAQLIQAMTGSNVLTITKSVVGGGSGSFNITVTGSNGYINNTTVSPAAPTVLSGLASGVYTVTESSPGAGWTTSYAVTSGTGTASSSNAVVALSSGSNNASLTAAGVITGVVYNDYNGNGGRDTAVTANAATDSGIAGVVVTAYDRNGTVQGTATTNANGVYALTTTAGSHGPYRLQFTNLPAGYEPSRAGSGNGTSVQFVDAPATNVNLGILQPCDYCQNTPAIAGSYLRNGLITFPPPFGISTLSALYQVQLADIYRYPASTARFSLAGTIPRTILATTSQVGALYGVTWHKASHSLLAAAYAKTDGDASTNTFPLGSAGVGGIYRYNATSGTTTFMDLDSAAYFGAGSLGTFPQASGNLVQIGKVGLGSLKLSSDQQTLYVMDLYNKRVLGIPVGDSLTAPAVGAIVTYPTPTPPSCPVAGDVRPFAIGVKNTKVYVGVTCTNESVGVVSNATSTLAGYIYELDPSTGSFSLKVTIPFTYARATNHAWVVWGAGVGSDTLAEPVVSDIEFDGNDMLIGVRARNGDTRAGSTKTMGGDTLRACATGSGVWTLENNGGCGGKTVKPYPATSAWAPGPFFLALAPDTKGIGGGEWYWEDDGAEGEAGQGGLLQIPGYRDLLTTAMDPVESGYSPGFFAFNNTTGAVMGGRDFANSGGTTETNTQNGKASVWGDLVALCDPAPIEIGNRVWNDVNGNGVQDPGESGLPNLTVSRQGPTNTVTTVTDANGLYYFNNLRTNMPYTLTMSVPSGYSLTAANATALSGASATSNHTISDTIDSDAALIAGKATIYYTTGSAGQNNHGLDFGLTQPAKGQVNITNTPPSGYILNETLNTPDPVKLGDAINFTIHITNTGGQVITTIPLSDSYDIRYLQYVSASVPAVDNNDDGQLDWNPACSNLAPGTTCSIVVNFTAFHDTTLLPGGATVNLASSNTHTSTASVRINTPTAVEISNKQVQLVNGQVVLQWRTVTENTLIGFHLWREDASGQMVRLTSELMLAQQPGQSSGAAYTYTDGTATPDVAYRYVLELIDNSNQSTYSELGRVGGNNYLYLPIVRR